LACKSGYTFQNNCHPTPTLTSSQTAPDFKCDRPSDSCHYASGNHTFSLPCKCGLTPVGATFCPLTYSPTFTAKLRGLTRSCHTLDKLNIYECMGGTDPQILSAYVVAHFERHHSNEIRENDSCMQKHSRVSQYWLALKQNKVLQAGLHDSLQPTLAGAMAKPEFYALLATLAAIAYVYHRP